MNTMLDQMLGLLVFDSLVLTLDFFGLLMVSEFTTTSKRAFDPRTHPIRQDITWTKGSLFFFIKQSKTDQAGKGSLPTSTTLRF